MKRSLIFIFTVSFFYSLIGKGNDTVFVKLDTIKSDSLKIVFLENVIDTLLKKKPEITATYLDSAFAISKKLSGCCKCDLLLAKAKYFKTVSSYNDAYKTVQKAINCYEAFHLNTKKQAAAYNLLAILNYYSSKFDEAISDFNKSASIYHNLGDSAMMASSYINIGNVNVMLGKPEKAIKLYQKAFEIARNAGDSILIARVLNNMGVIYNGIGKRDKALENYNKALEIYKKLEKKEKIADEYNNMGVVYKKLGNYEKAVYYYNEARKIYKNLKNKEGVADQYNNMGLVFYDKGDYEKAIENLIKAADLYDEVGKIKNIVNTTLNISMVYIDEKEYDKAIFFLKKAIKYCLNLGLKKQMAMTYRLFGRIYIEKDEYDKAIDFLIRSVNIEKKINHIDGLASSFDQIGNLYLKKGEPLKALTYFTKSLEIYKKLSQLKGIASVYANIANSYYKAYEIMKRQDFLNKAIENAEKSYEISNKNNLLNESLEVTKILKDAYEEKGDKGEALFFADKYEILRDSVFEEQKQKMIYEMQARFENKQKEQELKLKNEQIARINAEKQRQELEIQSEKRIRLFITIGAIILVVLLMFIYRSYRQKVRFNDLLQQKNNVIEVANAKLNQLLEEVSTQKDELENQKIMLEEVHNELKNSIRYAEKIQQAVFPSLSGLKNKVADFFVMYLPRDIVSGDFYWFTQVDEKFIFVVADCTGHGVPGAFMSILGISLLREIVELRRITDPDEILNTLREEIIYSLKHDNSLSRQDGMDMSIITVNEKEGYVQFSGANNGILVTSNELTVLDGDKNRVVVTDENDLGRKLYEFKPDKMPVGTYPKKDKFTSLKFLLTEDMNIYMFTDGYADQFGGEKGKKLKSIYFKNLILRYSYADMNTQKRNLVTTFFKWRGAFEQVDDVTVVGLKF